MIRSILWELSKRLRQQVATQPCPKIPWGKVCEIVAFGSDALGPTEVLLTFHCVGNSEIVLDGRHRGYYRILKSLPKRYPSISPTWYDEMLAQKGDCWRVLYSRNSSESPEEAEVLRQGIHRILARLNESSRVTWGVTSYKKHILEVACKTVKLQFVHEERDRLTTLLVDELKRSTRADTGYCYIAYALESNETMAQKYDELPSSAHRFVEQVSWYVERLIDRAPEIVDGDFDAFDSRTHVRKLRDESRSLAGDVLALPFNHPIQRKYFNHDRSWLEDMKREKSKERRT